MASDRMMQAIGALERAISRLEQDVAQFVAGNPPSTSSGIDVPAAKDALRSLTEMIEELKGKSHG